MYSVVPSISPPGSPDTIRTGFARSDVASLNVKQLAVSFDVSYTVAASGSTMSMENELLSTLLYLPMVLASSVVLVVILVKRSATYEPTSNLLSPALNLAISELLTPIT